MPYKSDQKLNELIAEALKDPTIQEGLSKSSLTARHLADEVKRRADEVWAHGASRIAEYDAREQEFEKKKKELADKLPPEPERLYLTGGRPLKSLWGAAIIVGVFLLLPLALRPLFAERVDAWLDNTLASVVRLSMLGVAFLLMLNYVRYVRKARRVARREEELKEWASQRESLERLSGIKEDRERLASLGPAIDDELVSKIVKDRLRLFINRNIEPSYETTLTVAEAPGLAEIIDPARTVDTAAKNSLRFMLDNMPGGSIGIAGPRGSGKSTLIQAYCGPKRVVTEIKNGKPILPVLVSAPVEYEARDFILYLFSATCESVLKTFNVPGTRPELQEEAKSPDAVFAPFLATFLRLGPSLFVSIGTLLIIFSLAVALLLATLARSASPAQSNAAGTANAAGQQTATNGAEQPAQKPAAAVNQQPESFLVRFIRALELKPGSILMWGVFLIVAAYALRQVINSNLGMELSGLSLPKSFEEYQSATDKQRQQWHRLSEDQTRSPLFRPVWVLMLSWWYRPQFDEYDLRARLMEYEYRRRRIEQESGAPALAKEAQRWLERLRFQQSFTSGWSGALKLPIGLEGSIQRAFTLSQNQMSNPEIVSNFTEFLRIVSEQYQVIVGIDELDKLASDQMAQQFLNEIKSVFGLPNCFYLISVSENAMSNFERRGIPFRDVFDSSFDDIVYVDYMSLEGARNLIARRVIGNPIPFICLSYCLAGGLARDLIRAFRYLLELRQHSPEKNDLSSLCGAIVGAEIRAKARAVAVAAKKIELEPEVGRFLNQLHRLEGCGASSAPLLKAAGELVAWRPAGAGANNGDEEDKEEAAKYEKLLGLREELGTYIYYAVTLLDFFKTSLTGEDLKKAEREGGLDELARARQALSLNPSITRGMVSSFRKNQGMEVPGFGAGAPRPQPADGFPAGMMLTDA